MRLWGGGDRRTDGKWKPERIALCGIIGHRPKKLHNCLYPTLLSVHGNKMRGSVALERQMTYDFTQQMLGLKELY